jgi:4-alpha-glucanotransferase
LISRHEALKTLSDALGIEPYYVDNFGLTHYTDPQTAVKIISAQGIRIESLDLGRSAEILIISAGKIPEALSARIDLRVEPDGLKSPHGTVSVREKYGKFPEAVYALDSGEAAVKIDEKTNLFVVEFPTPPGFEVGEYVITAAIAIDGRSAETTFSCLVCPAQTYMAPELENDRKVAGVQIALYGVRSQTNWGVGDFGDLRAIIDWAADDLKVDFVGLNPIHALENKRPVHHSPYNPSSRLYRNYIYLDVTGVADFAGSKKANSIVGSPDFQYRLAKLREEELVNYEEVADLKLKIMREVFRTFIENQGLTHLGHERWTAFQQYIVQEGVYLQRFAIFCALREHFQKKMPEASGPRQWPEEFRSPETPEIKQFQRDNEEAVLFWMYLQWQLDEQLRGAQDYALGKGMLIGLYNDEALAVDRDGADFWAWRDLFHDEFRVGAPPDAFAPDGQDWGFPPPNTQKQRESGYKLLRRRLNTNSKYGAALRIDHVMQLYRLFWIPTDGKPKDGVYVKDFVEDLLNVLAIESHLSQTIIIGEDLGTAPYGFRDLLAARGILSYKVFYFERDNQENMIPFYNYPKLALATVNTHDLPTLAGFWSGRDIEIRSQIGQLDDDRRKQFELDRKNHKAKIIERLVNDGVLPAETAHEAWIKPFPTEDLHASVMKFVLYTPSKLAVVSQEDLFLDLRQQNVPGTTSERPNWVTKMRYTVEELRSDPEAVRLSAKFRGLVEQSGRARR